MNFKTKVSVIEPYKFSPTDSELFVTKPYDKDGEKVFDVQVDLTQILEGGKTVQSKTHTFPASMLEGVITFNPETLENEVNWDALKPLFASFGLNIVT